jgi:hypothetical protein
MDNPALPPVGRTRLKRELTLFDTACSCTAPWLSLAVPVTFHPQCAPDALPPALGRMVDALKAMGTPVQNSAFPLQVGSPHRVTCWGLGCLCCSCSPALFCSGSAPGGLVWQLLRLVLLVLSSQVVMVTVLLNSQHLFPGWT